MPVSEIDPAVVTGNKPTFSIYIHWPFCRAKCPYCDFNSHVRDGVSQEQWAKGYVSALQRHKAMGVSGEVCSVFFGGGTPSLMAPSLVAQILDAIARHWPLAASCEITLEANPTSVEAGHFAGYRDAGVNRLSLGVQSFDDAALRFLGRQHSGAEAKAAIGLAARYFERFSFDMIYGLPDQPLSAWQQQLEAACALAVGHLSLYQLVIEPGTPFFHAVDRGQWALPDEDRLADFFALTNEKTATAGYRQYEISNYAQKGQACRHNLGYWRYQPYLGIGPGAHGRPLLEGRRFATTAHRRPEAWLQAVLAGNDGFKAIDELSPSVQASEMLLMGMRLQQGLDLVALRRWTGRRLAETVDVAALQDLCRDGYLQMDDRYLRTTARGRPVLDHLLSRLMP